MSSKQNSLRMLTCVFAAVALVGFYSPVARGEMQLFACWVDFKGGSEVRDFQDCSEVDSYNLSVGQIDDDAVKERDKMQCEQHVLMQFDIASADLALRAVNKETLSFTVFFFNDNTNEVDLEVESTDWIVRRVDTTTNNNSLVLQEIAFIPSGTNTTIIEETSDSGRTSTPLGCPEG